MHVGQGAAELALISAEARAEGRALWSIAYTGMVPITQSCRAERGEQWIPAMVFKREKETYLTGKKWSLILLESPQK